MKKWLIIVTSLSAGTLIYMTGQTGLVRNYLPDLLWGTALLYTAIWMRERHFQTVIVYMLLSLPILTETGQLGLFAGTFDVFDLVIYIFLVLAFFHLQITQLCKKAIKRS